MGFKEEWAKGFRESIKDVDTVNFKESVAHKTMLMREGHIFFRLKGLIQRYRLDSEWVGDRTKKYLLSHADELERFVEELKEEVGKIAYEDVR